MPKTMLISVKEYWDLPEDQRPDTYEEILKLVHRRAGIWQILTRDKVTGEVLQEQICENCITDNGGLSLFKNTMNYTSAAIPVANIIAVDQSLGYTTLATTIASGGTVTSITVGALTGPTIPIGAVLCIGAGGATKLFVTLTAAITGAGTYAVTSTPGPGSSIASTANIRYANQTELTAAGSALAGLATTDAASLSAPVSYTAALPVGQFTISGSGNGNRQMSVNNGGSYLFSTTTNSNPSVATTANYTAGWLVNASPVASTANTFVHVAFDAPVVVSSTSTGQCTISERL